MKIIIDGTIYSSAPSGGAYRYFNELIPRLSKFPKTEVKIFAQKNHVGIPTGSNIKVAEDSLPTGSWLPEGKLKQFLRARKRELQSVMLRRQFSGFEEAVYHSTYYTPSPLNHITQVVTVHDMISELFKETYDLPHLKTLRKAKAECLKSATRVIAISNQTKKDLQAIYHVPESKIDVVYHGVDYDFFSRICSIEKKQQVLNELNLTTPYFLYVGGRLHHKNFKCFLKAFSQSKVSQDHKLAVAGAPWDEEEIDLIRKLNVEKHLIWMPTLGEHELPIVYQNAIALGLPSHYEGFGLPLIESMAAGCPVLASNTGPFPELAEGAAVFFDPRDEAQMEKSFERVLEDSVRTRLIELGKKQAMKFSWDLSAKKHWECYQKALKEHA